MTAHSQALDALYQKVARGELIVCPPSLLCLEGPTHQHIGWCHRAIRNRSQRQDRCICRPDLSSEVCQGPEIHGLSFEHLGTFFFFSILSDDECNLQEVHHPDEAMPPITEFVGKGKWYLNITIASPHYALPRRKRRWFWFWWRARNGWRHTKVPLPDHLNASRQPSDIVSFVSFFDHTFFDLRSAKYVDTVLAEMQFCRYLKILRCRKSALLLGAISAFGFWIACRMRHSRRRLRFTNVANVLPRSIAMPRKWWINRVLFLW